MATPVQWTIDHLVAQEPAAAAYLAWDDSTLPSTASIQQNDCHAPIVLRDAGVPSELIISMERKLSGVDVLDLEKVKMSLNNINVRTGSGGKWRAGVM